MTAQFAGANNAIPGPYVEIETISRGVSIPSGSRLAMIIGEGSRSYRIVSTAAGGGNDGFNSSYTSTSGADGRHFLLPDAPLTENRTTLYKNGIPLTLLEDTIDANPFDARFSARLDSTTGRIELQGAQLVDQGGAYYRASGANTGNGTITALTLLDANAPAETWTIKCLGIRRDTNGVPMDGYGRFIAVGSISGNVLDGYGNQVVWQSNGTLTDNTVLEFAINEGAVTFREGDAFIIQTSGGALIAGDSLSATFIPTIDINDPQFFTDINELQSKHGAASTTNTLALGAQILFANGAPGLWALEAAPPIPRRVSYSLVTSATGDSDADDLTFALPINVIPDVDSNINFFVTDPVTGTESQIIPNKVAFYDASITAAPTLFTGVGAAYDYSYTVILEDSVQKSGEDGVLTVVTGTTATLSSDTVTFNIADLAATRSINITNATNAQNNGVATIVSIAGGVVTVSKGGGFVTESAIQFQVLDSATTSARILFTDDLALTLGQSLRATVIDQRDATFFDAGWVAAYDAAEAIDVDMVVPLPRQTISAIFMNGKTHVTSQSTIKNKHERLLFIGAIQGLEPDHVIGTLDTAVEDIGVLEGIQGDSVTEILAGTTEDLADYGVQNAYGDSYRVVYMYPDEIVVSIGGSNTVVDGFYLAAAAAGFFSGTDAVNMPLTNKTLGGFTILRNKVYKPIVLENLCAAGITVVQPVAGGGTVIWGKTTTTSGYAEEEEISIVFIRDRIAKNMRAAFKTYTGRPESDTFHASLYQRADSAMISFVGRKLITDYKDLKIVRNAVEPRQWDMTARVQPVYSVNWFYVKIGLGMF